MTDLFDAQTLKALAAQRRELAPEAIGAFHDFSRKVFADGALDRKTKQVIAVAVAHVTQCPWCIRSHTKAALREGVTPAQLMEAVWVAAEMRAGAAYAHSGVMLDAINQAGADAGDAGGGGERRA